MTQIILREGDQQEFDESIESMREYLQDGNPDRVQIYETPAFRYRVFTTVGQPLDPYTAPDLVRGVDRIVREFLPTRYWPHGYDGVSITIDIVGKSVFSGGGILSQSNARYFNSADDAPAAGQQRIEGVVPHEIGKVVGRLLARRSSGIIHIRVIPLKSIARY